MKFVVLKLCMVFVVVAAGFGFASDEETRQLEVHAQECIDYLKAFTGAEYNPQKVLRSSFEDGSLLLYYDEEVVKQTDDLANKWIEDCEDLFDSDIYGPKIFKNSPLVKVIENLIKDQKFAQKQADQSQAEQIAKDKKEFKLKATFRRGVLEVLEVVTPYYGNFQYRYNGENLVWGRFESENPSGFASTETFSYKFVYRHDSLYYYSPFKHYWISNSYSGKREYHSDIKTWEKENAVKDVESGKIDFDEGLFSAMSQGTIDKSWAVKLGGAVGLAIYFPTDDILDDNGWVEDTSGFNVAFLIDVTIGVVHCSPSSGRCFGFGGGYAKNIFFGNKREYELGFYKIDSTDVADVKIIDNVKVYGEYYLKGKSPLGIRQSIDIPLNADMKYITFKTGYFYDSWTRFEMGVMISPVQYVPGLYLDLGFTFKTPAF